MFTKQSRIFCFRYEARFKKLKMHQSGPVSARKRERGHQIYLPRVPKRHFRLRKPKHHHPPKLPVTATCFLTFGTKRISCWRRKSSKHISISCSSTWYSCNSNITRSRHQSHQLTTKRCFHRRLRAVDLMEQAATEAQQVIITQRKFRLSIHHQHLHQRQLRVHLQAISATATVNFHSMTFMDRVVVFWALRMRQLLPLTMISTDHAQLCPHRQYTHPLLRPRRPGFIQRGSARWNRQDIWKLLKPIHLIFKRIKSSTSLLSERAYCELQVDHFSYLCKDHVARWNSSFIA